MSAGKGNIAAGLAMAALWAAAPGYAAAPVKLSGSIVGLVSDSGGVPQMGAMVLLYNRYDRLMQRALTTEKGAFSFSALLPDNYTVRVTLASFLPALRRNIVVQPGMQSLLNVNLAHVFSTIELVAVTPGNGPLMSDEWKWVLRSASATRPILRFMPDLDEPDPGIRRSASAMFSETRGLVRLSAGDQASFLGNEPDLGTAFALATSFLGKNQLQVAGNVGYASYSGVPTAAFRTSFRREMSGGMTPEVRLTMRQLFLPSRVGAALLAGMQDSTPVLRSLSAAFQDQVQLTDQVRLEYGMSLESVTFLDRLNYFSPYGRLTWDRGKGEAVQFAYVSGTPAAELFASEGENDLELQQDISALALFPRVSLRSGRARVQRAESWEIGYHKKVGTRTYSLGAFTEDVNNSAVTMVAPDGVEPAADLLPDLFSNSWIFNTGHYHSVGYMLAVTQDLGERFDATLAYGSGNALTAEGNAIETGSPDAIRRAIRTGRRQSLTARVSGTVPRSGTQFMTSYQWASVQSLTPAHLYLTQRVREGLGLNIRVRQPIPYFGGLPGHVEATAEMRNLLAQGYVPLMSAEGRRIFLMHTPRSLRGGLSFTF